MFVLFEGRLVQKGLSIYFIEELLQLFRSRRESTPLMAKLIIRKTPYNDINLRNLTSTQKESGLDIHSLAG